MHVCLCVDCVCNLLLNTWIRFCCAYCQIVFFVMKSNTEVAEFNDTGDDGLLVLRANAMIDPTVCSVPHHVYRYL